MSYICRVSMKKCVGLIQIFLLIFLTISCTGSATPPEQHAPGAVQAGDMQGQGDLKSGPSERKIGDHMPAQVLVKFKEGTQEPTIVAIASELHLQTLRIISRPNLYLMKIQGAFSVRETIERLQEFQAVEYAEPNYARMIQ